MVLYRRNRVPDGTFFFTATLRDRSSDALVRHVDALRAAWQAARARVPHAVIASVVLPDHLHAVTEMRDGAGDYSRLWQEIKKGFTRRTRPFAGAASPWQSRFWEHTIRDQADLRAHIDYVHVNPMKHGLVGRVADWPHSSFHRYVRSGDLPTGWAGDREVGGGFGER
jgi:putative transposase